MYFFANRGLCGAISVSRACCSSGQLMGVMMHEGRHGLTKNACMCESSIRIEKVVYGSSTTIKKNYESNSDISRPDLDYK